MMFRSSRSSFLVAAVMVTLQMTSLVMTSSHGKVSPVVDVTRTERSRDTTGRRLQPSGHTLYNAPAVELPYFWLCPDVRCPELSADCVTVEYFEFEYEYTTSNGKLVTVRCRSCSYCIDVPASVTDLQRRASPNLPSTAFDHMPLKCSTAVQCPSLPDYCVDIRLTSLLIGGNRCKRCPACYDNTVVSMMARHQQ